MILATNCLLHEIQWFNWICGSQCDIFSNLISVLFSELTRISFPGQNGNPLSLKQNGKRMACYDFMITCNKKELWQAHDNSYKVNWSKMNDRMISWPIMIMIIMIKQDSWKITWPIPQDGGTGKPLWTRCLSKKFTIVIIWSFDQREREIFTMYIVIWAMFKRTGVFSIGFTFTWAFK